MINNCTHIFETCMNDTAGNRYIAIVQPFEERANWKQALLKIMMTWAIALLVAIPTIFFSTQFAIRFHSFPFQMEHQYHVNPM